MGQILTVRNIDSGACLAETAELANTFFKRLKGLMLRKDLPEGAALILEPCNMIHTSFMRFPIDVLFVDSNFKVLHIIENMPAWKGSDQVKGARYVVELPSGMACRTGTKAGHVLAFQ